MITFQKYSVLSKIKCKMKTTCKQCSLKLNVKHKVIISIIKYFPKSSLKLSIQYLLKSKNRGCCVQGGGVGKECPLVGIPICFNVRENIDYERIIFYFYI